MKHAGMNLNSAMFMQKKNVRIVSLSFIAAAVVLQMHINFMVRLPMLMILDAKCRESVLSVQL